MKKKLLSIIICLLLTGCTANYNLEIVGNNFYETISGNVLNSEIRSNSNETDTGIFEYLLNSEQPVFKNNDTIFYNKILNNKKNSVDFENSYKFNNINFNNSRILDACFENHTFKTENNIYYIFLSGKFNCAYADKTNISLTTKHLVTTHNADKVNKNKYTWTINKNEEEKINIYISIDKSKTSKSNNLNWSTTKTITLIILILLSSIAIFIGKKIIKN